MFTIQDTLQGTKMCSWNRIWVTRLWNSSCWVTRTQWSHPCVWCDTYHRTRTIESLFKPSSFRFLQVAFAGFCLIYISCWENVTFVCSMTVYILSRACGGDKLTSLVGQGGGCFGKLSYIFSLVLSNVLCLHVFSCTQKPQWVTRIVRHFTHIFLRFKIN